MKYIKLIIKNTLQAISTSYWYLTKEMTCNISSYKIAFTLTINRAQGQSASKCGILLPKSIWTHGQIYVAFSRCGNPNNIYVWAEQQQFHDLNLPQDRKFVKNVVYMEGINK